MPMKPTWAAAKSRTSIMKTGPSGVATGHAGKLDHDNHEKDPGDGGARSGVADPSRMLATIPTSRPPPPML